MSPRFLIISHSFQGIHPFFGRKIFRLKSCSITKGRGPGAAPGPLSNRSPTRSRGNSPQTGGPGWATRKISLAVVYGIVGDEISYPANVGILLLSQYEEFLLNNQDFMESSKGFFRGSDGLGCLGGSSPNDVGDDVRWKSRGRHGAQFNAIGNSSGFKALKKGSNWLIISLMRTYLDDRLV